MNRSAGFFCVGPLPPFCAARKAAHFFVVVAALVVGRFPTVAKIRVVFEADPMGRGPETSVSSAGSRRRAHRLGVVESVTNVLGGGERKFARPALGEAAGTDHAPREAKARNCARVAVAQDARTVGENAPRQADETRLTTARASEFHVP